MIVQEAGLQRPDRRRRGENSMTESQDRQLFFPYGEPRGEFLRERYVKRILRTDNS